MKYAELYNKAADMIESGWTQHALARTVEGNRCNPESPQAVCWCLVGAIDVVSIGKLGAGHQNHFLNYLGLDGLISSWNDQLNRSQEDVVKLLRDTAKRADREDKIYGSC